MVIDCSNTLPQFLVEDLLNPTPASKGYFQLFGPRWAAWAGWSREEFTSKLQELPHEQVSAELAEALQNALGMEAFIGQLKESGVRYHAIHNMDYGRNSEEAPADHDRVADILLRYPGQFLGFAGFNPHKGTRSLRTVRRALTEQGYRAVVLPPYNHGVQADDRKYYPLYALCEELEVPVWIHSSINYLTNTSMYVGHPSHLEAPLLDFPDLRIIAGHGGWPWVPDMVGLLLKYNNLYVDTSAFRPKYISEPNTGWDVFMSYANNLIQNQILFSSDWLSIGFPIAEVLKEIEAWPLKDKVREKFLWKNAANLFKLKFEP